MRILYETLISRRYEPAYMRWRIVTDLVAYSVDEDDKLKREPHNDLRVEHVVDDHVLAQAKGYDPFAEHMGQQALSAGTAVTDEIIAEHGLPSNWKADEQYGVKSIAGLPQFEDLHPTGKDNLGAYVYHQGLEMTIVGCDRTPGCVTMFEVRPNQPGYGMAQYRIPADELWLKRDDSISATVKPPGLDPTARASMTPPEEPPTEGDRLADFFGGKSTW